MGSAWGAHIPLGLRAKRRDPLSPVMRTLRSKRFSVICTSRAPVIVVQNPRISLPVLARASLRAIIVLSFLARSALRHTIPGFDLHANAAVRAGETERLEHDRE
jgi:hypothetical protein